MATATAARNFNLPNKQYSDVFKQFTCDVKPARKIRPNGSFPSFHRSLSCGSPTFPRRKSSPVRSKSVHFADSKGLALVSVLTFNEENEILEHLAKIASFNHTAAVGKCRLQSAHGSCKKDVGIGVPERLIRRLAWQKVCVASTEFLKSGTVKGDVYVTNLAYEKVVKVRFSWDSWQTHQDIDAEFRSNCSKDIDKFVFQIPMPRECASKNFKVEFAVSYTVLGDTFWDNNNGFNYHVLYASHKY